MYRLLKRYSLPVQNLQLATIQINLQQTSQVCSFCSFYHFKRIKLPSRLLVYQNDLLPASRAGCSYSIIRHQSTSTNEALLDEKSPKKIKHKIRKYAELLEVSGKTTTNTKAKIQKLTAASVSTFANQPEISLDQLHRIKKENTASNHETLGVGKKRDIEQTAFDEEMNSMDESTLHNSVSQNNLPEDETSIEEDNMVLGSSDHSTMVKNASVLNTLEDYPEEIMNEISLDSSAGLEPAGSREALRKSQVLLNAKRKKAAADAKADELERQGKQESLRRSLHSFIDVCINCGMMAQAFTAVMFYRQRGKYSKYSSEVNSIVLYNTLLHGFASIGNLDKAQEVLKIIAEDSIKPNPQTYAAIFECVGRMKHGRNHKSFLDTILSEMTEQGIVLNDILDKSMFTHDQREMTEQGIRILEPDFKAIFTPPDTSYTNHLMHKILPTSSKLTSPAKGIFTTSELHEMGRRQMELESQGQVTVKSIAADVEITPLVLHCREKVIETEKIWRDVIAESFRRDLACLKIQNSSYFTRTINIYPYLIVLDEHHYIDAVSNEIRNLALGSETFSPSINTLTRELGLTIFHRYQIETKKQNGVRDKISGIYEKYCDRYLNGCNGMNTRSTWQNLLHEEIHKGPTADIDVIQWPATVLASIGRFFYNILLRDIRIDANLVKMKSNTKRLVPAFYAVFRNNRMMLTQEIKPHPALSRMFRDAQLETLVFKPAQLPCLSPPVPWYSLNNGGYLISDAKIIRLSHQAVLQLKRLGNLPEQQLFPVLDCLNQLGSIPWKVNNSILSIALKIFQDGGAKHLDIPEPQSDFTTSVQIDPNATKEDKNELAKIRLKEKRQKSEMYSLWCEALYRLSLANHFRNDVFWLPHSMDFRGRVYPIPPHVNHLGSDLARSLMVFALGKPLGPDGLDWLKIHIINLTGLKKREANSERLKYANEMLPKILDSAEKPLTGEKWWQESEEPWQTLAACFEIAEALKSPNPSEYVSQFPIHQDGSCNGLQHYAALGRDQQGAESVNLAPSPKPQDVYSLVVALVEKQRRIDADNNVIVAQILDGLIKRKVIKQTVMTTVYGVTKFGARLQIARQLKEIEFPEEHLWQASHYLVTKTFDSLREMFTSAKAIQDWLTDCARLVTSVCGQNMEWITPLGLPVVQPYSKNFKTVVANKPAQHFLMDMYERPNVMKQKNAFPPNFIHSLDSSHMMLTSVHCEHAGLTFVSVHDCFWTHACTISAMNKICREEFVALHSDPILENLSKFLVKRFAYKESEFKDDGSVDELTKLKLNKTLTRVPKQGDFDLRSVLDSVYFFS